VDKLIAAQVWQLFGWNPSKQEPIGAQIDKSGIVSVTPADKKSKRLTLLMIYELGDEV
jgi:hypothetical protein